MDLEEREIPGQGRHCSATHRTVVGEANSVRGSQDCKLSFESGILNHIINSTALSGIAKTCTVVHKFVSNKRWQNLK